MPRSLLPVLAAAALALLAPAAAGAAPAGACSPDASLVDFSDGLDKATFDGTDVGGLSALAPRTGRPLGAARALTDNQGDTPARVYDLRLGRAGRLDPAVRGVTTLTRADGTPYTGADFDGEGLVTLPGGGLLASSETEPTIRRFDARGREAAALPVPDRFRVAPDGEATTNLTLEGLGASPDGRDLWAGMEGPLAADGAGRVRFLHYERRLGRYVLAGQVGYRTDDGLAVSDVQVARDGSLLVLERGFEAGVGNTVRVYQAFPDNADDVTDTATLTTPGVRFATKRLLADLGDCPPSGATTPGTQANPLLDNVEGMALARDGRTLLLVSDDNFSAGQVTRVYRLRVRLHPAPRPALRFATFNASLNRGAAGDLETALRSGTDPQIANVAEIVQRTRPDVLNLNEFDFLPNQTAVRLFQDRYLAVSQHGARPIRFPYRFVAPSNTGIPSGKDLDGDGQVGTTPGTPAYANDAFGFGLFEGQYGLAVLSRLPIDRSGVRTFQRFLWKDMPGALLPDDPATPEPADFYSPDELDVVRLSSKSHWDVPIRIGGGEVVHFLVSHPTPPTFDGPEDRNGRRNHDEIRLWSDYVTPGRGDYLVDDRGRRGGLEASARFVIAGDQNADPVDGDSTQGAVQQLLGNPRINAEAPPRSPGGPEQAVLQGGANATQGGDPATDTADFADTAPGNLRADYVLPDARTRIQDGFVFWPATTDPLFGLVGTYDPARVDGNGFPSSDHRLTAVDLVT